MTERYDVSVIGAGADGLAAAALLARAGLRTIVLERRGETGGRLALREFHPGFRAAPFVDAPAPIPDALFRRLDLARHGALQMPAPPSPETVRRRAAALAFAALPEPPPPPRWNIFAKPVPHEWPPEDWSRRSLAELDGVAQLDSPTLDPFAPGSALALLAAPDEGPWRGLDTALLSAAREAGAEIACNREVGDIRCEKLRVAKLGTADGGEIAARAVLSTLDLKRTFLSLFAWSALPPAVVKQIGAFRMQGSVARLLLALSKRPVSPLPRGPIRLASDGLVEAHAAWRAGILAEKLPLTLRFPSATDPGLAPIGAATMTVTIGAVPHTPFDGVWTHEKRSLLTARVLGAVEEAFPGLGGASIVGQELLTPPDIEEQLGATAGDLAGGAIAPDQMFAFRPGFARKSPYTPVEGLYLAGPSSAAGPLGACVSGAIAADALIADLRAGKLP